MKQNSSELWTFPFHQIISIAKYGKYEKKKLMLCKKMKNFFSPLEDGP
jgi:hypothetical protein